MRNNRFDSLFSANTTKFHYSFRLELECAANVVFGAIKQQLNKTDIGTYVE